MSTEALVTPDGVPLTLDDVRDGFTEIPPGTPGWKRRLLMRQIRIERGIHPVTGLPIHAAAPHDADPKDRFPRSYTCGTCVHRLVVELQSWSGNPRKYPKCDRLTRERMAAKTSATDTPRWMPACVGYTPTEGHKWQ